MKIIKRASVDSSALLTPSKELRFLKQSEAFSTFVDEECKKAFHEGEKKGELQGYTKALAETEQTLSLIYTLARKLLEKQSVLLDRLKPEVVEFALVVCERVIRKELSHPEVLARLINTLLSQILPPEQKAPLQIFLAPEDLVMLNAYLSQIHHERGESVVRFLTDPLLRRGDCRIEMPGALLNYSVSRELANLQAKVFQT